MTEREIAMSKANYCAGCVIKPCQVGCPLNNDITKFISLIKEEKYLQAYKVLLETTLLPGVCGLICPHEKQCQGMCAKGVSYQPVDIGYLEAFIGKQAIENNWKICDKILSIGKKVAVVGGGPAGLTCAGFLAKNGVDVTIFEKYDYLGGLLVHGIPDFRLNKDYLKKAIDKILDLEIKVKFNCELGVNLQLEELEKQFDAIFLGFGANISSKMNIEGEELEGVYGGNELLEKKPNLDFKAKTVIVSGGGNVAMDVSRTFVRKGARVIVVYRRSEKEMPAERKEIAQAKEEGVEFLFQTNILKILGVDKVEKIECIKTELIKKDGQRPAPVNIEGSNFLLPADMVVMAVGSLVQQSLTKSLNLQLNGKGKIEIDSNCQTSNKKIFAGGDNSTYKNIGTVAWACRAGRDAAYSILQFLKNS